MVDTTQSQERRVTPSRCQFPDDAAPSIRCSRWATHFWQDQLHYCDIHSTRLLEHKLAALHADLMGNLIGTNPKELFSVEPVRLSIIVASALERYAALQDILPKRVEEARL